MMYWQATEQAPSWRVPAHDERDWDFAKQFGLDIIPVLEGGNVDEAPYTGDGLHINSDFLDVVSTRPMPLLKMVAWLGNEMVLVKKKFLTASVTGFFQLLNVIGVSQFTDPLGRR